MIKATDLMLYANARAVRIPFSVAQAALSSIDRPSAVEATRSRYDVRVWDGAEPCPVGPRERWLQLSPTQLARWDVMDSEARMAYLPRAQYLMRRRNLGTLTPDETKEVATMPVPQDGLGFMAMEAAAAGKATYFVLVDGQLRLWQPVAPHEAGRQQMELADESHPYHWKAVADRHVDQEVQREVDAQILGQGLEKALDMLESRPVEGVQ